MAATTRFFRRGEWYNDSPSSARSCCQMNEAASEFSCQGLELDMPIVGWGADRLNSYRVLLTRGRDGTVISVPPEPEMDSTYDALLGAGCRFLSSAALAAVS